MTPPFTADEARAQLEAMEPHLACMKCGAIDPPTAADESMDGPAVIHAGCPMDHPDSVALPLLREALTPALPREDLRRAMETIIALTEAISAAMAARERDARHLREWMEAHAPTPETSTPADP